MSDTLDKFMQSIKKIKHPAEQEFDATDFMSNILRRIEFTNYGDERVIARSSTELMTMHRTQNPEHIYFLVKNAIRFYTTAMDMMVIKAQQLCEEQGRVLEVPDRLARILYQKKFTRVTKRASTGEGPYDAYVREESETGGNPKSFVAIELGGFIFPTTKPLVDQLIFTGITRGLIYHPVERKHVYDKNIENLF